VTTAQSIEIARGEKKTGGLYKIKEGSRPDENENESSKGRVPL
jgi:hypothetical protein